MCRPPRYPELRSKKGQTQKLEEIKVNKNRMQDLLCFTSNARTQKSGPEEDEASSFFVGGGDRRQKGFSGGAREKLQPKQEKM
jgi:hypothetical protein